MFHATNTPDAAISVTAMGLCRKMEKDPPLRIKDWRKVISAAGPRIMARTKGAISNPQQRKAYPRIPEPSSTVSSNVSRGHISLVDLVVSVQPSAAAVAPCIRPEMTADTLSSVVGNGDGLG